MGAMAFRSPEIHQHTQLWTWCSPMYKFTFILLIIWNMEVCFGKNHPLQQPKLNNTV